jgi:hypothetical protein
MGKKSKLTVVLLASAAVLSSKDKSNKVPYNEMAAGMRDAFNCGVIVEQYLHGRLKGHDDAYQKERAAYNCGYVESVLNTLNDQGGPAQDKPQDKQ